MYYIRWLKYGSLEIHQTYFDDSPSDLKVSNRHGRLPVLMDRWPMMNLKSEWKTSCNNILYINICYDLFVRQTWARAYPANHVWDGSWGWWRICQLVLGRPSPTWVMKNTAESGQAQGLDFETVDPLQVFQGCSKRGFGFRICLLAAKNRNASSFSPNFAAQIWFLTVNWKTQETKKFAKDAKSLVSLPNEISMV